MIKEALQGTRGKPCWESSRDRQKLRPPTTFVVELGGVIYEHYAKGFRDMDMSQMVTQSRYQPRLTGLNLVNRRKISTDPTDQKTAVYIATRHNTDVIYFHRYLTAVKSQLQGLCQVQHAPFAKASGAVDSRYGLECLSLILSTTSLEPTSYDAIVFNFGMHDIDYSKVFPEVRDRSRSCYVVVLMNVINAFSPPSSLLPL